MGQAPALLRFTRASENINFAIKTGAVRDFLDNGVVAYRTAEKTADIAQSARSYTMLISCTAMAKEMN